VSGEITPGERPPISHSAAPHLARHREVAALDLWSADAALRLRLEEEGSGNLKRVRAHDAEEEPGVL
jgi:hypothetical protein